MALTHINLPPPGSSRQPPRSLGLTLDRETRVFLWRAAAAVTGSAVFGLIAARLLPLHWLLSSFLLAFAFGFSFVGGTGYRILRSIALNDASSSPTASWTGAEVSVSASIIIGFIALLLLGGNAALLLAAYGISIGVAYAVVKVACLQADCCRSVRATPFDLRRSEITISLATVVLATAALASGYAGLAAFTGVLGHLAARAFSRFMRRRLPNISAGLEARSIELTLLSVLLVTAALLALTG